MIHPGLCSVTFDDLPVATILSLVADTGLQGIEWGARHHVLHGDLETAKNVGEQTREAGLIVSSYGSYYRLGVSAREGLPFQTVAATARALGAPVIRIWAGNREFGNVTAGDVSAWAEETRQIADVAMDIGVKIAFEYHGGTLTNTSSHALQFIEEVDRPDVYFYWQPPHGYSVEHKRSELGLLLDRLENVHVFHWTIGAPDRDTVNPDIRALKHPDDFFYHLLSDGREPWRRYLSLLRSTGRDHWALLEFVKDGSPESFRRDAATLVDLINGTTEIDL